MVMVVIGFHIVHVVEYYLLCISVSISMCVIIILIIIINNIV